MSNNTDNNMQETKPDIFDKIMHLPGLRVFEPLYKKYKEVLLYLFFGVLTTVVSIGSYAFFNVAMGINELIANVISWVFAAPTKTVEEFMKQLVSFAGGRVLTLVIEEIILLVFITMLHFNSMLIKFIAQVVVIILNYVISKLLVFRKDKNKK